jgi:hypothetical protein
MGREMTREPVLAAALREVLEETGHQVFVHEFLGTLVYESGGRSKVVHYWRMETNGEQVCELMDDVKAVEWLPLDAAVERLSRAYERVFLVHVGPLALEAAAPARFAREPTAAQPVLVQANAAVPLPAEPKSRNDNMIRTARSRRRNLVQKVRGVATARCLTRWYTASRERNTSSAPSCIRRTVASGPQGCGRDSPAGAAPLGGVMHENARRLE